MREYGFELRLCAHLEHDVEGVIARQLGGAVATPGARVMDVVLVEPGPEFDDRTALTPASIPSPVVEADIGVGRWQPVTDALPVGPERARVLGEHAADLGVLERRREDGRTVVRRAAPYPDWIGELTGIENKPDLGSPGALARQVRMDIAVGVFDRVVVATASHVTGAHLNRLPDAVGVWEYDPDTESVDVRRSAELLAVESGGVEITEEQPLQTDIEIIDSEAKAVARRRIAERAYGKGWRPQTYPRCQHGTATDVGLPYCTYFDRVVDPAVECGDGCPGYEPGPPPVVDTDELRAMRTGWEPDPPPIARTQAVLEWWATSESMPQDEG